MLPLSHHNGFILDCISPLIPISLQFRPTRLVIFSYSHPYKGESALIKRLIK